MNPSPKPTPSAKNGLAVAARESALVRRNVGEIVADHIRRLVFDGSLADGERVPQREIAEALGVSSIPVREALVALEREGVVAIHAGRGAFVNGLDPEVALEQFCIFGRIYGLAARRAAERADRSWLDQLDELAGRISRGTDLDEILDQSIRFQLLIVAGGGSKRLRALFNPLSRIVPGNFYVEIPGSLTRTRRGVAEIAAAIRAGNPDHAERACWDLMDEIGAAVASELRRRSAERS